MDATTTSRPSHPVLPATLRLRLPPGVAAALETLTAQLLDHAPDDATAHLPDSLPRAETRALLEDLRRCANVLERIAGYGDQMSLSPRDVRAVAAAGRAAEQVDAGASLLAAALEGAADPEHPDR